MDEKNYEITLADGTTINNLKLNGNNYIAPNLIDDSVFENNLGNVTISDGIIMEVYKDMELIQNTNYGDGKSWFILAPKSSQEKEKETLEAKITDLQLALVEIYESTLGGA